MGNLFGSLISLSKEESMRYSSLVTPIERERVVTQAW